MDEADLATTVTPACELVAKARRSCVVRALSLRQNARHPCPHAAAVLVRHRAH
jgi:hypothetical protein